MSTHVLGTGYPVLKEHLPIFIARYAFDIQTRPCKGTPLGPYGRVPEALSCVEGYRLADSKKGTAETIPFIDVSIPAISP